MSDPLMMLGSYRFSLDTAAYEGLERSTSWRWGQQAPVGNDPILQFVGPGEDVISLNGVIYPHHAGGLGQIDKMRESGDKGEPLILMTGYGRLLGKYVIEKVSESQSAFIRGGAPRRISFSINLRRYSRQI